MTALFVQSALLIAIAFIVGAIAGCLARKAFGAAGNEDGGTIVAAYGLAGPGVQAPRPQEDHHRLLQEGNCLVPTEKQKMRFLDREER